MPYVPRKDENDNQFSEVIQHLVSPCTYLDFAQRKLFNLEVSPRRIPKCWETTLALLCRVTVTTGLQSLIHVVSAFPIPLPIPTLISGSPASKHITAAPYTWALNLVSPMKHVLKGISLLAWWYTASMHCRILLAINYFTAQKHNIMPRWQPAPVYGI